MTKKSVVEITLIVFFHLVFSFFAGNARADLSSTFGVTSNYLFNGITLTEDKPAFQPSLDWSSGTGFYGGLWASNVSFDPNVDVEFDGTVGYVFDLGNQWGVDVGVAQYTYYGQSNVSAYNYPEAYVKLSYAATKLSYWYASDYFGAGGGHYIVMLSQAFQISEDVTLALSADSSTSTDTTKFLRDDDGTYQHWRVALAGVLEGVNWTVAFDNTNLELSDLGEPTWSVSVSKTISWM
jgi:uncharacterized protein (TIGR02001 family)